MCIALRWKLPHSKFFQLRSFLCMAFAQLTYRESLRDIETCLRSMSSKLYHIGFRGKVSRSTLAYANENRNCEIYSDFSNSQVRRVRFYDEDTKNDLEFLTNNFELPALTIAKLYKQSWQVELFFKWIKQYLRIKAFFGTSRNAVETQIWIAISIYLLIAIIKSLSKIFFNFRFWHIFSAFLVKL